MQFRVVNSMPVGAKVSAPRRGQIFVLRHDVLDRVFVYRDTLFSAIVLDSAKPVAAAPEVVEVAHLELPHELLIGGESPVRRQQ